MDILNFHLSDTAANIWGFCIIFLCFLAVFRGGSKMKTASSGKGKYIVIILIAALVILLISALLVFRAMKWGLGPG